MKYEIDDLIWTPDPLQIAAQKEWISKEARELGLPAIFSLALRAVKAREISYAPYSGYMVSAALLCVSTAIYPGFNAEIHTYSGTTHAERMAVLAAISGGEVKRSGRKFVRAIAISHSGDSAPCCECRQGLLEHCDNALIIVADENGKLRGITSLDVLAPWAFKPSDLEFSL